VYGGFLLQCAEIIKGIVEAKYRSDGGHWHCVVGEAFQVRTCKFIFAIKLNLFHGCWAFDLQMIRKNKIRCNGQIFCKYEVNKTVKIV
jgi:hypothetical protein